MRGKLINLYIFKDAGWGKNECPRERTIFYKLDITCIHRTLLKPMALYRTKLLPVTHVLVDTWMLNVKPVYKV